MILYIVEDDPMMADCMALAVRSTVAEPTRIETFYDAVTAMEAINTELPDVILLDVMLSGPDGFTFLNEMISYHDTARVPVVLVSSLDLSGRDLSHYGVVAILDKATMTPEDIAAAIMQARNTSFSAANSTPTSAPSLPVQPVEAEIIPAPDSALSSFNQKLKHEDH